MATRTSAKPYHSLGLTDGHKIPHALCQLSGNERRPASRQLSVPLEVTDDNPLAYALHNMQNGITGLSLSRYAPKNGSAEYKPEEVWVRLAPPSRQSSTPSVSRPIQSTAQPIPAVRTPTPVSASEIAPGPELPYTVQFFILEMMRKILEDACYAFTSKHAPSVLHEKSWTCSEQVELHTWRETLPQLPAEKFKQVVGYSLVTGLRDATNTRNQGTHRHICPSSDLRAMTVGHMKLMVMFQDEVRYKKFMWLHDELLSWDEDQSHTLEWKQSRLEAALKSISERPAEEEGSGEEVDDPMEIDG